MLGIPFADLPLAVNGLLFASGAAAVWFAGTRLSIYVDALAERTGIGRALLGLVLLAGITSLPEAVTSLFSAAAGNPALAVNNLLGGIVMQTAILAAADVAVGRRSLSYFTPQPELLLQGILLMVLLALALAGIVAGEALVVAGVGAWTALIAALYLLMLRIVARFEGSRHWRPVDLPDELMAEETGGGPSRPRWSPRRIGLAIAGVGLLIVAAGTLLVGTSDAIAAQTGLGSSFVGATLLATSTSLPELSTTLAAVRLRAYSMAFANIFGSNAIMAAFLFLTDVAFTEGPILDTVDRSGAFAAAAGIAVTGVYLVGLILRDRRVFLRMGVDSLVVLVGYALTLAGLYALRAG